MTMTEARTRRELEARAAEIEAELESRKSASEKAADMLLNPVDRTRDGKGWEPWEGVAREPGDGSGR